MKSFQLVLNVIGCIKGIAEINEYFRSPFHILTLDIALDRFSLNAWCETTNHCLLYLSIDSTSTLNNRFVITALAMYPESRMMPVLGPCF